VLTSKPKESYASEGFYIYLSSLLVLLAVESPRPIFDSFIPYSILTFEFADYTVYNPKN